MELAPIYVSALEQGGLLYQPLHFMSSDMHYIVFIKPELDDVIKEYNRL